MITPGLKLMSSDNRRFTVDEYHRLIQAGILTEDDRCELLEGILVQHEPRSPQHEYSRHVLADAFRVLVPEDRWLVRHRSGVTLSDSEPEPDLALVRVDPSEYMTRHPGSDDFGVIVEVSDTTLSFDRTTRHRIYAGSGLPAYWIVNVVDRQVEVYEQPSGPTANATYGTRRVYKPGDSVPLVLDGNTVGTIPVAELLP